MSYKTTHTTKVFDEEVEIELDLWICSAEPDVGIMGNWVDDWKVIAVDGNTDRNLCADYDQQIVDYYGEDKWIERLYDEGIADGGDY